MTTVCSQCSCGGFSYSILLLEALWCIKIYQWSKRLQTLCSFFSPITESFCSHFWEPITCVIVTYCTIYVQYVCSGPVLQCSSPLSIDIHLILNLVSASMSFKSAESWTPICLPKFNDTGFLHTYVSYLPHDSPACLLLFSTDKEKFFELQECQNKIAEVSPK